MQKIVLAGMLSNTQYTYAASFALALQELGYEVISFNTRPQYQLPAPQKIKKMFRDHIMNKNLIKTVAQHQPEMLFLVKAENIFAGTLQLIKKKFGTKIINFYPDNPFAIWNGNSTPHILASLPIYDHFLIWSEALIPALFAAGCKQTDYFPFAFDEKLFDHVVTMRPEHTSQVCFIGTWEPMREQLLTTLCKQLPELDVALWGNLWREHIPHNHVLHKKIRGPAIYHDEMVAAIRGADIVLNFIRKQNASSHNMRTFEVPAAGGFILTERTYEQAQKLFIEDHSIACFEGADELTHKIIRYLYDPEKRKKISIEGYKTAQNYTLKKQLSLFLKKQDESEALFHEQNKGPHHGSVNS